MKPYDLLTGILFLVLAGTVFFDALRIGIFPIGAGTMPVIIAILLAACAVALIISSLKRTADAVRRRERFLRRREDLRLC